MVKVIDVDFTRMRSAAEIAQDVEQRPIQPLALGREARVRSGVRGGLSGDA